MIQKELDQIEEEDLLYLIENAVLENKTLEYKQELNLNTNEEKKEFLADISSFSNASGGDVIYGIVENRDEGTPERVEGISNDNIDELKGKIEGLIRDGTEPRVVVEIQDVNLSNSNVVLIIRVPKSWRSPHRVIFRKDYKFYSRNSTGKYHLDVEELRNAFNLSETLTERIRRFREDRISQALADEMPISMKGAKFLLHLVPIKAFDPGQNYEIDQINKVSMKLRPIYGEYIKQRYNIDGLLSYEDDLENYKSYVQLFRNGIIEAATNSLSNSEDKKLYTISHEEKLIEALNHYLIVLKEFNVDLPIFLFLTMVDVKGFSMSLNPLTYHRGDPPTIDRSVIFLPEVIIDDYNSKPEEILKICFDSIWNACGYDKSPNYNENGEWKPERE